MTKELLAVGDQHRRLVEVGLRKIGDLVTYTDDPQKVLEKLVALIVQMLGVQRCAVVLLGEEEDEVRVRASYGIPSDAIRAYEEKRADPIARWVALNGKPLHVHDLGRHPAFNNVLRDCYTPASFLSVPLTARYQPLGVLNVNGKADGRGFTKADATLLKIIAKFAVIALEKARTRQIVLQKERLDAELGVARQIQSGLLLGDIPHGDQIQFATRFAPAREISGDFYDVLNLGGRPAILLGDVCGKGVPAALYMARVLSCFRSVASLLDDSDELFSVVNNQLEPEWTSRSFVTACLVVFDESRRTVRVTSAGHLPPYLVRDGTVTMLDGTEGLPLGIDRDVVFEPHVESLEAGDSIVAVTDGITEAANGRGELFGRARAEELLRAHADAESAEDIADGLMSAVRAFTGSDTQSDDQTVVVATCTAGASRALTRQAQLITRSDMGVRASA